MAFLLLSLSPKTTFTFMLLQKTLHMSQPVAECKARLASIQSYRRQFLMVKRETLTWSKQVDSTFRGPLAFQAQKFLFSSKTNSPVNKPSELLGETISVRGTLV